MSRNSFELPDYPTTLINLIDALKDYIQWVEEWRESCVGSSYYSDTGELIGSDLGDEAAYKQISERLDSTKAFLAEVENNFPTVWPPPT